MKLNFVSKRKWKKVSIEYVNKFRYKWHILNRSNALKDDFNTITFVDLPEKILNGNHTSEIMALLGEDEAETYRVDFEKDLDSKESNCIILGNLLNKIPVEKVDVHENDVKRELYQIMDERAEEGLDPKPPETFGQKNPNQAIAWMPAKAPNEILSAFVKNCLLVIPASSSEISS